LTRYSEVAGDCATPISNTISYGTPGAFADPLTEVLRNGARALLTQAVEAEVSALLSVHADKLTDDGRARLVRHGHLPEREIMTGIGPVAVRCPRVRDRVGQDCERIRFSSAILPPNARRSKSLEVLRETEECLRHCFEPLRPGFAASANCGRSAAGPT
jgi:putative transposase